MRSPSLPPLVLLLCPAVREGAVPPVGGRVTAGVAVRVTVAAGGRSVADLRLRNCRKGNTLIKQAQKDGSYVHPAR